MTDTKTPPVETKPVDPIAIPSSVALDPLVMRIVLSREQADGQFIYLFNRIMDNVYQCAVDHGFWEGPQNDAEKIALCHAELSECLEAFRKDNPPDDKINEFTNAEAELADVVIRIMDFCKYKNFRLADAILAKHRYNLGRPYKHGKKF